MSRGGEGRGEHTRQGNSEFVSWEIPNADYANEKKKSLRVRYVYSIIFLVTNLIAWFLRDYGQRIVPQLHCKENFFLHLSMHFHFTSTTLYLTNTNKILKPTVCGSSDSEVFPFRNFAFVLFFQ